jgi:hypothetical protein
VPDKGVLSELKKDYESMVSAGMLHQPPWAFADMMSAIKVLEQAINAQAGQSAS